MSFRNVILLYSAVLIVAILALAGSLYMLFNGAGTSSEKVNVAAPREPGREVSRVIGEHIRKSTIAACEDDYLILAEQLVQGLPFTAASEWTSSPAPVNVMSSLIGMDVTAPPGRQPAIGLVGMTAADGDCSGHFTRIVVVAESCQALVDKPPAGSQVMPPLGGVALMTLPNQWRVLLMPAGEQCVVVTAGTSIPLQ